MKTLSKLYVADIISQNAEVIENMISTSGRVRAVFSGHSHTNYVVLKDDTAYISTSSLAEYPFEIRVIDIYEELISTRLIRVE